MSDIPAARKIIAEVRMRLHRRDPEAAALLESAEGLMVREKPAKPPAPPSTRPLTAERAAQIRAYARRNPKVPLLEMALRFKTGLGRVSEALHGKI